VSWPGSEIEQGHANFITSGAEVFEMEVDDLEQSWATPMKIWYWLIRSWCGIFRHDPRKIVSNIASAQRLLTRRKLL
jgi:hypothetical protein